MDTPLQLSFDPGEVISAGTPLGVTGPRTLDPQSAQSALRIRPARGAALRTDVRIVGRGDTAELTTSDLPPGGYELLIGGLRDTDGEQLAEPHTVAFTVGALTGDVPSALRVEHAVQLAIGELDVTRLRPESAPPAEGYFEVVKAVDRKTGEPVELAFDATGQRVDAAEVLGAVPADGSSDWEGARGPLAATGEGGRRESRGDRRVAANVGRRPIRQADRQTLVEPPGRRRSRSAARASRRASPRPPR